MMERIQALCKLEGISGREDTVRDYIKQELAKSPASMEVKTDPLGNLLVHVEGQQRAAKRVLFAAHMDEVGLIITSATSEGFLRFATVGGIDPRVLYGRRVRANGHWGVIGGKAMHLCDGDEKRTVPPADILLIDIGATNHNRALTAVPVGTSVTLDGEFRQLGELVTARALDDRIGCALLLELVQDIPPYDLLLAFTVQEEIGTRGAMTAAYTLKPDIAVAVETTTAADIADVPTEQQVCCIGKGAVLSFMDRCALYDRALYEGILRLAGERNIPAQPKQAVAGGNDAGALQRAGSGCRVAAVSVPCRYLHSAACTVSPADVESTAHLLRMLTDILPQGAL